MKNTNVTMTVGMCTVVVIVAVFAVLVVWRSVSARTEIAGRDRTFAAMVGIMLEIRTCVYIGDCVDAEAAVRRIRSTNALRFVDPVSDSAMYVNIDSRAWSVESERSNVMMVLACKREVHTLGVSRKAWMVLYSNGVSDVLDDKDFVPGSEWVQPARDADAPGR